MELLEELIKTLNFAPGKSWPGSGSIYAACICWLTPRATLCCTKSIHYLPARLTFMGKPSLGHTLRAGSKHEIIESWSLWIMDQNRTPDAHRSTCDLTSGHPVKPLKPRLPWGYRMKPSYSEFR